MKKVTKTKTTEQIYYEAIDGTLFSNEEACRKYEDSAEVVLFGMVKDKVVGITTPWELLEQDSDENKIVEKQFDDEAFMEYMRTNFPETLSYHFTYDLLENIIRYLMNMFDDNTHLAIKICEIVPEIKEDEVLKFCLN